MNTEFVFKSCILCLLTFYIAGCSYFTSPKEHPMITNKFDEDEGFAVSATDVNRRVALINLTSGQVCVEPPPEAANTISEAFAALFKADVENKADIAANLSKSITQNITQLYRRTQTVQLFRDSVFAICQNAINGQLKISQETHSKLSGDEFTQVKNDIGALKNGASNYDDAKFDQFLMNGSYDLNFYYDLSALSIDDESLKSKKKNVETILIANLNKDEYARQVSILLSDSYASLREEFKYFYEAEKLRFITELAKPVQVCNNVPVRYEDDKGKVFMKQECKSVVPTGMDSLIKELIKIISEEQTKT